MKNKKYDPTDQELQAKTDIYEKHFGPCPIGPMDVGPVAYYALLSEAIETGVEIAAPAHFH